MEISEPRKGFLYFATTTGTCRCIYKKSYFLGTNLVLEGLVFVFQNIQTGSFKVSFYFNKKDKIQGS